jgi:hypothetical protein
MQKQTLNKYIYLDQEKKAAYLGVLPLKGNKGMITGKIALLSALFGASCFSLNLP